MLQVANSYGSGEPAKLLVAYSSGSGEPAKLRALHTSGSGEPTKLLAAYSSGSGEPAKLRALHTSGSGEPAKLRALHKSGSGEPCGPPAASRCSARRLAARSFPRRPPARGASRLVAARTGRRTLRPVAARTGRRILRFVAARTGRRYAAVGLARLAPPVAPRACPPRPEGTLLPRADALLQDVLLQLAIVEGLRADMTKLPTPCGRCARFADQLAVTNQTAACLWPVRAATGRRVLWPVRAATGRRVLRPVRAGTRREAPLAGGRRGKQLSCMSRGLVGHKVGGCPTLEWRVPTSCGA